MTTLISVGSNSGQRSCDARCYDAIGPDCDCVCGGANHSQGREKAEANTMLMATSILTQYKHAFIPRGLRNAKATNPD